MRQIQWTSILLCGGVLFAIAMGGSGALAAVKTEVVKYKLNDAEYVGFLAYDDSTQEKRPGVLVSPEWMGLNDYAKSRATQLAGLGYVALALDPYGGGKIAADTKQAAEWATALKTNPAELRARANAALEVLRKNDHVDATKIAAIGYCFGGTTVLQLARGGADIRGVVSFHGDLATPTAAGPGSIKAKVLALHGADDPFVPPETVAAFEKEMKASGADWQLHAYGSSVHGFTNPANAKSPMPGVSYNEKADKRSWQTMLDFFNEIFGK